MQLIGCNLKIIIMKRKFYLEMIVALSVLATSMFTSCSDDDSDPKVSVEVADITGSSATISWDLVSSRVLAHEVVVKEKDGGTIVFEDVAGVDLSTSSVMTEIEATGLSAETEYTVTVTALTLNDALEDEVVGEGSANFTTVEGDPLLEVTEEQIVGTWFSSNRYYIFNADKSGENGSHSEMFGDEKEDDITWEITSYEYEGAQVRSIKATDSEGYWNDLEVVLIDGVMKLKDHDNNYSFVKE